MSKNQTKKVKKTILEKVMEEQPGCIESTFDVEEAGIKKGVRRLKLVLDTTLKKTNRYYRIYLTFNRDRFEHRVEMKNNEIQRIESDATLFDSVDGGDKEKKTEIKKYNDEIKEVVKEMKDLERQCPDYDFDGEAEKVEYNKETLFLRINKDTLSFINDKAEILHNYKIMLKPIV